jgi:hypothetical protein
VAAPVFEVNDDARRRVASRGAHLGCVSSVVGGRAAQLGWIALCGSSSWRRQVASTDSVVAWTTRPVSNYPPGSAGSATFRGNAAAARELAGALVGDSQDYAQFTNG